MDRVESYLKQLSQVVTDMPQADIWNAIDVLMSAWERQAMIYTMGNGGSASTASHMANDLNNLTIVEGQPRFRTVCITDKTKIGRSNISRLCHTLGELLEEIATISQCGPRKCAATKRECASNGQFLDVSKQRSHMNL